MCGIVGGMSVVNPPASIDRTVIERVNAFQRRRGPDGEGVWRAEDGGAVLGQRRLAIIDVGDAGAQPMSDATGRWVITFNGEIYNYRELRRELEALGRRFLTNSDTEVLINCIAEWGESGLRRLRGMYAFGLWDNEKRELWLARDPFGIKPLYFARSGGAVWFASQARALAQCAPVNVARSAAGLVGFYLWGAIPEPFTWWEGVEALPAGGLLRIVRSQGDARPRRFLAVEDAYQSSLAAPITLEELRAELSESIRYHLVADVPVGVFLSAGIDSSIIACLAKEAGCELRTVTLAFDEYTGTDADEAPLAEATAKLLGAHHQTVRISRNEFVGLIDDFFASMDQPTTDGLNTYLVGRAAAKAGLKVALSGLGGDELFGGYPSFRQVPDFVSLGKKVPMRAAIGEAMQRLGGPAARFMKLNPKLAPALKYGGSIESAYFLRRCLHPVEDLDLLLDESWRERGLELLGTLVPDNVPLERQSEQVLSPYAQVSRLEVTSYMRNQPLRDTDWASMAHSLEVRVPFLDLELLARLAPAIASNRPPTKQDLAACGGSVGSRLVGRRKTGFATPVSQWLGQESDSRGLRPWADIVAAYFRNQPQHTDQRSAAAAV